MNTQLLRSTNTIFEKKKLSIVNHKFARLKFLVLLIPLFQFDTACSQEEFEEKDIQQCRVLGVAIDNAEALTRGDVLIKLTETFDNVKTDSEFGSVGAVYSGRKMSRFSFDFMEGRFLQAWCENLDGTYFPSENKPSKKIDRVDVQAAVGFFDLRKSWQSKPPYQFHSGPERFSESISDFLFHNRMVNPRGFWLSSHLGKYYSNGPYEQRINAWEIYRHARNFNRNYEDADGNKVLEFKRDVPTAEEGQRPVFTVLTIDKDSQLPIEIREFIKLDRGDSSIGKARIRWEQVNDIYVPTLIKSRYTKTIHVAKRSTTGVIEQELEFHWFSVNEELDPDLFNRERIKTEKSIMQMLDPVETGADSLVEKQPEKEKETDKED